MKEMLFFKVILSNWRFYLTSILREAGKFTGASLFQYLSFRAGITFILALFISTIDDDINIKKVKSLVFCSSIFTW